MIQQAPDRQENYRPKKSRALLLLAMALIVGIALAGLFIAALSGANSEAPQTMDNAITPTPEQPELENEAVAAVAPTASKSLPSPQEADNIVAVVNGRALTRDTAEVMHSADLAIAELLGAPAETSDLLERLINGELVWQAILRSGFDTSPARFESTYATWMQAQTAEEEDWEELLSRHDLSSEDFKDYFIRLLLIDSFVNEQAVQANQTPAQLIDTLQQRAQISFGPSASLYQGSSAVAQASPEMAEATPAPLPSPTPAMSVMQETSPFTSLLNAAEQPAVTDDDVIRGVSPGQLSPDFNLPAINAAEADTLVHADLLGQPTVLSFWTTWCPYCLRQTPILVAAASQYTDRGVRFVGINVKESQAQVEPYLAEHNIPYPIALDASGEVANRYQVRGFPTTYFLDADGRVVAQQVGALTVERLDLHLRTLLSPPK
ncbi:MAG: redoxin domain-containing protein [Caldilineales bacterium]|nr:redoxin domain-containing protein [Caldilineales bacterium]